MIYSLSLRRLLWKYTVMCMLLSRGILQVNCKCKVLVSEPWPMPLLVPQDAYVLMNCTADSHLSPVWSIDLANDSSTAQHQFSSRMELLNSYGFYELPGVNIPETVITLRLLVNETTRNNETVIYCSHNTGSAPYTTLSVFEPAQLMLEVSDIKSDAINITWHHESEQTVRTFSLTITYGSHIEVIPLSESYYYFTAPEGAPPCEVYNFSVTATQYDIGATYTGAGCSIPSPVLSRTLPSLPDIHRVESSLSYLLTKLPNGSVLLKVLLLPPTYCPTHIYMLVVTLNESVSYQQLFTPTKSTVMAASVTPDLHDNVPLNFKVQVRNSLSDTFYETGITRLYITDVQNITVAIISVDDNDSVPGMVLVQCDFIPGSNAQGCMVILVGESHNITVNLTRVGTLLTACVLESLPMTTPLIEVFGYDIEFDGSVGTLQVPGISLVTNSTDSYLLCKPNKEKPFLFLSTQWIIVIASVGGSAVLVIPVIVIITIIGCYSRKNFRLSRSHVAAVNRHVTDQEVMSDDHPPDTMPYYDLPENVHPMRKTSSLTHTMTTSNDSDYSRTSHTLQVSPTLSSGSESTTYSRLQDSHQEHAYHVLENTKKPPHVIKNEPYNYGRPDTQPSDPPPIYHTIHDERPVEEQLYDQVSLSPLQSANSQSQETGPTVYQDIAEFSMYTNNGIAATQNIDGLPRNESQFSSTTVWTVV